MILTLVAESADGQLAYKDVSLRFSAATGPESYSGGLVITIVECARPGGGDVI